MNNTICIFCGANAGTDIAFEKDAEELARLLCTQGYDLVYGGGKTGLMGVVADQFLLKGRKVIGVRPKHLIKDESSHSGISEMIVVDNMSERKRKMMKMSDAFIVLPGGVGTLDELLDVYTQVKIGYMSKFIGLLNTNKYYDKYIDFLNSMVENAFLSKEDINLITCEEDPSSLMDALVAYNGNP